MIPLWFWIFAAVCLAAMPVVVTWMEVADWRERRRGNEVNNG